MKNMTVKQLKEKIAERLPETAGNVNKMITIVIIELSAIEHTELKLNITFMFVH